MAQPHLINYVKEQLNAGYTAEEIRTHLVSSGYPIREVDEAIDRATRAPAPAVQPFSAEKKIPKPVIKEEAMETGFDIAALFKYWFMSLFMPGSVFAEVREHEGFSRAFANILVGASLGAFASAIILLIKALAVPDFNFLASEGLIGFTGAIAKYATISRLVLAPVAAVVIWLGIISFLYLFSLLVGGNGSFKKFAYLTSFFAAPFALILAVLVAIVPKCPMLFVFIVFGVIGIYPAIIATKESHEFGMMQAILSIVIPIILVLVLLLPVLKDLGSLFSTVC